RTDCRMLYEVVQSRQWLANRISEIAARIQDLPSSSDLVWAFGSLGAVGEFAGEKQEPPKPFELKRTFEKEGIEVVLRDTDDQLCVYLDSQNRDKAGSVVYLGVVFPKGVLFEP